MALIQGSKLVIVRFPNGEWHELTKALEKKGIPEGSHRFEYKAKGHPEIKRYIRIAQNEYQRNHRRGLQA